MTLLSLPIIDNNTKQVFIIFSHIPSGLEIINSTTWLLHGEKDNVVPKSISLQLMQKLQCPVELKVIEDGTHQLYRPEDIDHMLQAIDILLDPSTDESSTAAVDDDD